MEKPSNGRAARRLSLSALLAAIACLVVVPAGADAAVAKAKPPAIQAVVYKASPGSEPKRLYSSEAFSLTGSCDADGVAIQIAPKQAPGEYLSTDVNGAGGDGSTTTNSSTWQVGAPVNTDFAEQPRQGEVILKSAGAVYSIDRLLATDALGRGCAFVGLVEKVPKTARVVGSEDSGEKTPLDRGNPDYSLDCGQPNSLTAATETASNTIGTNYVDPATNNWFGRVGELGSETAIVDLSGFVTIADVIFTTQNGRVSQLRGALRNNNSQGCSFAGGVKTVAKGASRVFYATDSTDSKRRKILDLKGLGLYASCKDGTMKVYASTAVKNAVLRTTIFGDSTPTVTGPLDFDSTAKKPKLLLIFGGLERTGQLIYARPDGRAVALNWSGWAGTGEFKRCGFTGLTRSG